MAVIDQGRKYSLGVPRGTDESFHSSMNGDRYSKGNGVQCPATCLGHKENYQREIFIVPGALTFLMSLELGHGDGGHSQ